jgi:hypothetical protein
MRVKFSEGGVCFAVLIGLLMAAGAQAQTKAKAQQAEPKSTNVQGTVRVIGSGNSTITVRVKNIDKTIVYSPTTKFLYGNSGKNKAGDVKQVKEGNYISCSGTVDAKTTQLMAKECVYRETK